MAELRLLPLAKIGNGLIKTPPPLAKLIMTELRLLPLAKIGYS